MSRTTAIDDDDRPVGKVLSRREVLSLFGAAGGAALLVACGGSSSKTQTTTTTAAGGGAVTTPANGSNVSAAAANSAACVVRPELTEGPYFVDEKLTRSDIRSDTSSKKVSDGVALALAFNVMQAGSSCAPIKDATVDVWHCDANGVYSDANDQSFNTKGQNFLRGNQITDANGAAKFTTIVPGWYQGRAVHIHFKIRTKGTNGQAYEFTSQLFFDEKALDQVFAAAPYNAHKGSYMKNASDSIYRESKGQTIVDLAKDGTGYAATFNLALDLSDTKVGAADGNSDGPGEPPPGR